jgi:hypothetical protein
MANVHCTFADHRHERFEQSVYLFRPNSRVVLGDVPFHQGMYSKYGRPIHL